MALYTVAELATKKDRTATLVRETFGSKYDGHYMRPTPLDPEDDEGEEVVIDEDAAGERRVVQVLCISQGFLGVRPYPAACSVIITNGEVFVAGEEEYDRCFMPL
jgi:hypothetical protein